MTIKKKIIISIITMLVVLLILPLIFVNLSKSNDGLGLMMLFFFVVNPITVIAIISIIGKDIKKLWWIFILFSFMFLLSYWLVLQEIILELIIYAIAYLAIGLIFMVVSSIITK